MMLICPAIICHSVFLSAFFIRSHVQIISCAISLVCHLKYPYSFYSHIPFLDFLLFFPVVIAVTECSNYILFVLVYVFFKSLVPPHNLASPLSPSFCWCHLSGVKGVSKNCKFSRSIGHIFEFLPCLLQEVSMYLTREITQIFISLCCRICFQVVFLFF